MHKSVANLWVTEACILGTAVFFGATVPQWTRSLDHTQRRTTVGRTLLDEWSARRRDLYLTTHNNHKRQTSVSPVGFEPTILAGERPQTFVLYRAATEMTTGIAGSKYYGCYFRNHKHGFLRLNITASFSELSESSCQKRLQTSCSVAVSPSLSLCLPLWNSVTSAGEYFV